MGELILVVGGARSGKSDYAQVLAESLPGPRCFVATCPKVDSEMDERIARHQRDRKGKGWQTVEEERDIAGFFRETVETKLYLLDCLTLWVNNLMYRAKQEKQPFGEDEMVAELRLLLDAVRMSSATVICVSNEVGMGIVPDNPTARLYRDLVGRCNRLVAEAADRVVFVSCGIPMDIKN